MKVNQTVIDKLGDAAARNGISFLGHVPLGEEESFPYFQDWLEKGQHAEMKYLEQYREVRKNPSQVLQDARTGLIFCWFYGAKESYKQTKSPLVAQYARKSDYHKYLKRAIEQAVNETFLQFGLECRGRALVDTAPVLERALAAKLKNVFVGKNTCSIHVKDGSYFLIGEWVSTLEFPRAPLHTIDPTQRGKQGGCGTCKRCQIHCPTGALDEAYRLDARKCLSYWTIEHRGEIPKEFWPHLGKYVYGCDICQNVCPYNRSTKTIDAQFLPPGVKNFVFPPLPKVALMSQAEYETYFGGSPMTRAKRSGLRRNALIALYVTGHKDWRQIVEQVVDCDDIVVSRTATSILEDSSE